MPFKSLPTLFLFLFLQAGKKKGEEREIPPISTEVIAKQKERAPTSPYLSDHKGILSNKMNEPISLAQPETPSNAIPGKKL